MEKLKLQFNYGSIAGFSAFLFFLLYVNCGLNPLGNISWLGAWIPILFIYLCIKKYRDEELEGFISYKESLSIGIVVSFVYASLFGMMLYAYGTFINADFLELHKNEALDGVAALEKYI